MLKSRNRKNPLSREAWLAAGLRLVVRTGVGGLKTQELVESLGSTTGSLRWHFESRA